MFTPLAPSAQGWLNPLNRGCKCGIGFGGRLRCHILARRLPRRPKRRHTRLPKQHKVSLGGWDPQSGERLWTLTPPAEGDFNVPTPLAVDGKVLLATENNGTRLYGFGNDGKIQIGRASC